MAIGSTGKMPRNLARIHDYIGQDLINLRRQWTIFSQLYSDDETVGFLRDTAPGFFSLINAVMLENIILAFSRFNDPEEMNRKKNLVLRQLEAELRTVKAPESLVNSVHMSIQNIETSCRNFKEIRNTRIAHRDLLTSLYSTTDPLLGITHNEIEEPLKMIGDLLNQIATHYGRPFVAYEDDYIKGNARDVVAILKYGIESYQEKTKRLLKQDTE